MSRKPRVDQHSPLTCRSQLSFESFTCGVAEDYANRACNQQTKRFRFFVVRKFPVGWFTSRGGLVRSRAVRERILNATPYDRVRCAGFLVHRGLNSLAEECLG